MEPTSPPPAPYRRLYLTTLWICIVGIGATLAATALEVFYFAPVDRWELGGCGLLAACPFAVVWVLAFLGRYRFLPTLAALLAAILGGGLALLLCASWLHEFAEFLLTGTSTYRGAGQLRGLEFLVVAAVEWAFGMPGFLLLYGLGWLVCLVKKSY
jgi:hypothetical protein